MNSQGSSSNSLPETFMADHVNHGNDVNNLGFVQSNHNPMESAVRDSPTVIDWMAPYNSSMINHNQVNPQEFFGGHGWLSSIGAPDGSGQGFQVSHSGTNAATFQESGASFLQGAYANFLQGNSSRAHHQNIDLNLLENSEGEANQDMGAGLSLSLFNPDGLEAHQNQQSGTSSVPVVISSGVAGFVQEENNSREDLSSDGRQVSCKSRAPEDAQEPENLEWHALSSQENANATLNLLSPYIPPNAGHPERLEEDGIGHSTTGALSGMLQTSSGAGQEVRRSADPQDLVPPSTRSSGTSRDSYTQPQCPPAMFSPYESFPNPSSAAPLPVDGTYPAHSFAHAPNSAQNLQPSPWHGLTVPPECAVNGGNTFFQQQVNSMSMPRNTMLAPETERGYVAEYPTAYHQYNSQGNIASSSQNGTLSGVHFPYAPTRVPEHNMTQQYGQRSLDSVTRFTAAESTGFECRELGIYCPLHSRTSAAAREMDHSVRSDGPVQIHQSYGWMTGPERQANDYSEDPFALEFVGGAQRTSRLVSEVRNVMALFRVGGGLWFEDVMVIDTSILNGVPEEEEDDMNEDMRLDVDDMSYEELLDLEEHIGSVPTGLSEEEIMANLRRQTYDSLTFGSPVELESCCICQEEFLDGEDIAKLDCGHLFHFDCIKLWLMQKNSCPICKLRALAVGVGAN